MHSAAGFSECGPESCQSAFLPLPGMPLAFPDGEAPEAASGGERLGVACSRKRRGHAKVPACGGTPGGGGADRRSGRSQLAVRRISLSIGSCVPLTPSVTEPPAPPPTTSWTIPLLVMPTGTAWPFASMPVSASV